MARPVDRQPVTVYVIGTRVEIVGKALRRAFDRRELQLSDRLGNTPRSLTLPDGARVITSDNDTVDRLMGEPPSARLVHWLETRWSMALLALACTIGIVWAGIVYGVPALAESVAMRVPPQAEQQLAAGALDSLDRSVFAPSQLPQARTAELSRRFDDVRRALGVQDARPLEFRSTRLGANAFALPGGLVVVTDDLVTLAQHDDEVIAVLAHELGHVQHRHALRYVLQNATTVLVIAALTGDVASSSALAAALPAMLIQAQYSRTFEREADRFALDSLRRLGIAPRRFADILLRLQQARGGRGRWFGRLPRYALSDLGTHARVHAIDSLRREQPIAAHPPQIHFVLELLERRPAVVPGESRAVAGARQDRRLEQRMNIVHGVDLHRARLRPRHRQSI